MRRVLNISFSDEGNISIDWMDTSEQSPAGGTYHQTIVTLAGREVSQDVEYWSKELRQDADEFLHHVLKMLSAQSQTR